MQWQCVYVVANVANGVKLWSNMYLLTIHCWWYSDVHCSIVIQKSDYSVMPVRCIVFVRASIPQLIQWLTVRLHFISTTDAIPHFVPMTTIWWETACWPVADIIAEERLRYRLTWLTGYWLMQWLLHCYLIYWLLSWWKLLIVAVTTLMLHCSVTDVDICSVFPGVVDIYYCVKFYWYSIEEKCIHDLVLLMSCWWHLTVTVLFILLLIWHSYTIQYFWWWWCWYLEIVIVMKHDDVDRADDVVVVFWLMVKKYGLFIILPWRPGLTYSISWNAEETFYYSVASTELWLILIVKLKWGGSVINFRCKLAGHVQSNVNVILINNDDDWLMMTWSLC